MRVKQCTNGRHRDSVGQVDSSSIVSRRSTSATALFDYTSALVAPRIVRAAIGDRTFPAAAASVWNSLPESVRARGVATGGISGYIPPKSVYLKFFMWLFCLLDPGQIRYRAIYTHPNQIPANASGCAQCAAPQTRLYKMTFILISASVFTVLCTLGVLSLNLGVPQHPQLQGKT